jgi:serine protease AprX
MPITRLLRSLISALSIATVVALSAPVAAAQPSSGRDGKLDAVVRNRARQLTGRTRVIVQFTGDADSRVFGRRATTGRRLGRDAQVAEVDNVELANLASDPRIERVMFDRPIFATLERTGLSTGSTAARQAYGVTGKGVGVAVIDSGVTNWHDDLYQAGSSSWSRSSGRVAHFKDFTKETSSQLWSSNPAYDDYGHGTHVAGIIAGTGYDSNGKHKGLAPGAKLIGLKVLDAHGGGFISDVIAAIDYAVSVKATYNIRVINLSVAAGVYESYWLDPVTLAARRAVDAGIVVVASAGNLGLNEHGETQSGGITSPGNAPWVLTVGASSEQGTAPRSDDTIGRFSSRGPTWIDFGAKPDLVAPGVGIESLSDPQSTLYGSLPGMLLSGSFGLSYKPYLSLSGTSMAAPVVAGTVALMLEANPSLTPNAVKAILQYTAQARPGESTLAQGAGMVNARGAIRLARFFASPIGGIDEMGDTLEGEWVEWARHIIWGNYRITGGVPLPGNNAWANDLRWGALETPLGTPVVWGARADDNIVWSTSKDDAGNIVWSTARADDNGNIVWSTARASDDNIVWSTARGDDNIVWSTADDDNIVWSTTDDDNIVWSTTDDDNIVWSTTDDDNIVWSTATVENVVWGSDCGGMNCQKVVWGSQQQDGTLWGTSDDDKSSGAPPTTTTSSGARPATTTTTSSGARLRTTTSSGARPTTTTSSGAPTTTTSSGARSTTTTSSGAPDRSIKCSGLSVISPAKHVNDSPLRERSMRARVTIIWLPVNVQ